VESAGRFGGEQAELAQLLERDMQLDGVVERLREHLVAVRRLHH